MASKKSAKAHARDAGRSFEMFVVLLFAGVAGEIILVVKAGWVKP
jgi:hypothetical protein